MDSPEFVIVSGMSRDYNHPDHPMVPYGILQEYHGPGGDVVIPEGVTAIAHGVFRDNAAITSVILPETLIAINGRAFSGCVNLKTVRFPAAVNEIDNYAFQDCHALAEVVLPLQMHRIGEGAFFGCRGMKKLTVPGKLERLGHGAFSRLAGLEEFIIPCATDDAEQVKFLSVWLLDLDELVTHYLRGHIHAYPALDKAFWKRLNTKPNRKNFFAAFLRNGDVGMTAKFLSLIPKMAPEELDEYILASEDNPEIRALFIDYKNKLYSPADLSARAEVQAEKDLGLRERTVADWKKIYKINSDGHITGYKLTDPVVEVPYKVRNTIFSVGANAFKYCDFLESVTIAEGVTLIDKSAFNGCVKLAQITIPSTLTRIGASAFKNCASLTHVYFPGGITNIGSKAFEGCENLTIHAPAGSKIIKYAEKNNISFVAE